MVAKLVVATGKNAGKTIALKRSRLLIGRADECDIRPLSDEVSRRHCAVLVEPEGIYVEDLRSRNGTFVNGVRIEARTLLADGDMLRIGSLELKVSGARIEQPKGSADDDISRWLMADDEPAGMFDTTQTLRLAEDVTRPVAGLAGSSSGNGAGPGVEGSEPRSGDGSASQSREGAHSSEGAQHPGEPVAKGDQQPADSPDRPAGGFLPKPQKKTAENSRAAAADALRKFFGNR
jgi:pSer/pThr/pTyr-binding forkhead associated (FHA) protein